MKKFAIFLICFVILCALCACGEVEPQANASNEPQANASNEPAPPSGAPSTEPPVDLQGDPTAPPEDVHTPEVVLQALGEYEMIAYGDRLAEFVLEQTERWHDIVSAVTVTKFRQGEFVMVYGHTLRFYEFGYYMTPRYSNIEAPAGWMLSKNKDRLQRDDGAPRYVVMYDTHDDGTVPIRELSGSQIESWYGNDWLTGQYGDDLETAALMSIYNSNIVGTELEPKPQWVEDMERLETFITVADADGNDISEEITTLWMRADGLFSEGSNDMFISTTDESGAYDLVFGYEEEVGAVFTARGRAQLQGTTEGFHLPLYRFRDGSVLKREPWYSGMGLTFALAETEVLSVTADRIEMRIPYDVVLTYDENHEPSVTERRWVDFAVAKTDDGWRVDNYPCPHAGVMEYDYESGDDICTPLFYASEADEIFYRLRTGRLYVKNPHWLSEDFGGATVEIETSVDGALTYVELWLDGGERGSARFTVDRDGSGEVLESEVVDWENDAALDDALMIEIAQSAGGITELTEGYVEPLISSGDRAVIDAIETMRDYREHNLELFDDKGRDISDEIIDLWIIANHIYGKGLFDGKYPSFDGLDYYAEIFNFEEVLGKFYTDKGAAQVREAQYGTNGSFFTERDGSIWMLCPGASGMSYTVPRGILEADIVEQTATRITLDITYDDAVWEEYGQIIENERITFEREGGVWKIADYDPSMIWLPSREATLTVANGIEPHERLETAKDFARSESLRYSREEYGFKITEVVVEGVEEAASLATESGGRMVMWLAKFRMKPDAAPTGDLGEYFEVDENGWITKGTYGESYIIGYESVNGVWHGIGSIAESTLHEIYGDAENLAEYGDPYTAMMSRYYEHNYDYVLYSMERNEPDAIELQGE